MTDKTLQDFQPIRIRASSVKSYIGCNRQWYHVFILGKKTIPNIRATIGTSIHAGVETMWTKAIEAKEKNADIAIMTDAAISKLRQEIKDAKQMEFDDDMDETMAEVSVIKGTDAYVTDIYPFTPIPIAVEQELAVPIDHKMVKEVGGTIDYIGKNNIADIKTSKRKVIPSGHVLQQSIYKYVAESHGYTVDRCDIQGIVLAKTKTAGSIESLDPNVDQAKYIVNSILGKLNLIWEGTIDPELLFPGNPSWYLCSPKYCKLHSTCPFVNGKKK